MFPNHFALYSSLPLQPHPSPACDSPFFPFAYPCFLPFALNSFTEAYRILQVQEQKTRNQFHLQQAKNVKDPEKTSEKQAMKKNFFKLEKKDEQASTGDKTYLRRSLDMGEQKEGRNANSNLLRMFFRRLQFKIENSPQKLLKIWNKYNVNLPVDEFARWVKQARIDYRNYIRVPSVKKLFRAGARAREHSRVLRVLLRQFLQEEAISCYLTSRKIKKDAMPHNLLSIRSICREIFTEDFK